MQPTSRKSGSCARQGAQEDPDRGRQAAKTWEVNLVEEGDTAALREEEEGWRKEKEAADKKKRRRSQEPEQKKEEEEGEEEEVVGGEGTAPEKVKLGGKTTGKKSLESLFLGTGLDPDPKHRKKLIRKVQKQLKKAKSISSSTSSSSSTASSELQEGSTPRSLKSSSDCQPGARSSLCARRVEHATVSGEGCGERMGGGGRSDTSPIIPISSHLRSPQTLSGREQGAHDVVVDWRFDVARKSCREHGLLDATPQVD